VQEATSTAKGKQTAKEEELESGHVVAELNFGFWIGMLANRYHQRLWEKNLYTRSPTTQVFAYLFMMILKDSENCGIASRTMSQSSKEIEPLTTTRSAA
jgi:hypothetical protein